MYIWGGLLHLVKRKEIKLERVSFRKNVTPLKIPDNLNEITSADTEMIEFIIETEIKFLFFYR